VVEDEQLGFGFGGELGQLISRGVKAGKILLRVGGHFGYAGDAIDLMQQNIAAVAGRGLSY